jgi:hypothetical protein
MKIMVLVRKALGFSVATRARSGFLIALVFLITIGVREAIRNVPLLSTNEAVVCIIVGFVGFFSWLAGRLGEMRRDGSDSKPTVRSVPPAPDDPLQFLHSAKYWGLMFLLSAGVLSLLAICRRPKVAVEARAREVPVAKVVVTNVVTITNVAPRTAFPSLELQGLVVNGDKSAAVINGRVLRLGEEISNVVLVAVDYDRVAVAMEGQTNTITLKK